MQEHGAKDVRVRVGHVGREEGHASVLSCHACNPLTQTRAQAPVPRRSSPMLYPCNPQPLLPPCSTRSTPPPFPLPPPGLHASPVQGRPQGARPAGGLRAGAAQPHLPHRLQRQGTGCGGEDRGEKEGARKGWACVVSGVCVFSHHSQQETGVPPTTLQRNPTPPNTGAGGGRRMWQSRLPVVQLPGLHKPI